MAVNALVGGMLGQERTLLPLLARDEFGLASYSAALTYIGAFGIAKAATNYLAGSWSERYGRKPVLVIGWLVAAPVPLLLIWAPWWWVVVATNLLLGISQGLTWSTTVIMKIDLVGPRRRGLAMGLNESAGYLAVAVTAMLTGQIADRSGLRPEPFYLGIAYAAVGLGLSTLAVRETSGHADHEAGLRRYEGTVSSRDVFVRTSFREPALSSATQAGTVNNLNDGLAWGLFPVLFASAGLSLVQVGWLVALYPAVWGFGQLFTGALSDRWGRKPLIVLGMLVQAAGLTLTAGSKGVETWALAAVLLGAGTAMVYPVLLAVVGDVAHPAWRGRAIGSYRLWRDAGFAMGALLSGVLADGFGVRAAVWAVAGLTATSGALAAVRMYETLPEAPGRQRRRPQP
jgi:MFS family permease